MVPGAELIDRVLLEFGLRYKKQRDAKRIASMMAAEEVPDHIRNLLRRIVSS
jgi:hypothetical protein